MKDKLLAFSITMPAFVFVHAKHPHMEAITQEYMDRNELMGGGSSANDRSLLTFSFKLYGLDITS